jgi:DNA-binding transcriptional ArsR family regulator
MSPRSALVEPLRELAWQQWTQLGVRGTSAYAKDAALDLEELILLTVALADDDPRLREEAIDWCHEFGHFVSRPKLKTLLNSSPNSLKAAFAPFGAALDTSPTTGWPDTSTAPERGDQRKSKASAPDLELPGLVGLRLRALFGVGSRADIICALLGWPAQSFTASDLVFIGYTKRSIAQTLESLAAGGLLRSSYVGNKRVFSWRSRAALQKLVGPLPALFPRWPTIFRVFLALLDLFTRVGEKSTRVAGVEASKLLHALSSELDALGFSLPKGGRPDETWTALVDWAAEEAVRMTKANGN